MEGKEKEEIMKSSNESCSLWDSATEDERLVAEILLDLENLWLKSNSKQSSVWVRRKRRSCLNDESPSVNCATSSSSLMFERTDREIEEKVEEGGGASISTDTPLGYLTGEVGDEESEGQESPRKRVMKKYLQLLWCSEVFKRELPAVQKYYTELKAHNSELRARKQELLARKEKLSKESQYEAINLGKDLPQQIEITMDPQNEEMDPHKNGLTAMVKNVDPNELRKSADKTCSVDPSQPSDMNGDLADKRTRSTEARKYRKKLIKDKVMKRDGHIK